ncbi:hypothetical protein ACIQNU_24325 [Streptomyces sp. NPDC091292]|uniref:hypothetical protein n=1 Tax=Streptomyces sp. NPDC091292 TaxID=3365991 RepID=UPI003806223B
MGLDDRVTVHEVARLLPAISVVRDVSRAMAMAEAILCPDWADRHYSFDAHWSDGEEMASMSDGSGDEYAVVLSAASAYVRGFAHESWMSPYAYDGPWPGVLDDVPDVFRPCVEDPAFCDEDGVPVVTACLWRQAADGHWSAGTIEFPEGRDDPDGALGLFRLLVAGTPEAYRDFAEDYYEVPVPLPAIRDLYALRPLTGDLVAALNPALTPADLTGDATVIGYPTAVHTDR